MKKTLFLLTVLGTLVLSSCAKKTDTGPGTTTTAHDNSYNITGAGFSNASYFMSSVSQQTSTYDQSANTTDIKIMGIYGDSLQMQFEISFSGSGVGTFQLADPNSGGNFVSLTTITNKTPIVEWIYSSQTTATVTVTSYPGVGGQVTGTFKGKFNRADGTPCTISNGTFKASRVS